MSKAFTKEEDDEVPERVGRVRTASGLPPGATNYMTADGARRLREELARARGQHAAELRHILESATVVPDQDEPSEEVLFGVAVTVRMSDGVRITHHIVGVDEVHRPAGHVRVAFDL